MNKNIIKISLLALAISAYFYYRNMNKKKNAIENKKEIELSNII